MTSLPLSPMPTVEDFHKTSKITPMTEIDGVEFLTTTEAKQLADEMEIDISRDAITNAAYAGNIKGARKLWDNPKAPWIFSKAAFLYWLENKKSPGRPAKES